MKSGPKKSLGQNFLINPGIAQKIAEACELAGEYGVIEIGPGRGALTSLLAKRAAKVLAIELDSSLIPGLSSLCAPFDNVEILCADALECDFKALIAERFEGRKIVIAGNLPYYITSPIIMKVLESRPGAERAVFLVQKEAAERLCAEEGSREAGASTLAVRWYSRPRLLFDVSPGSFYPKPTVTSSLISLEIRKEPPCKAADERKMFEIIKAAFSQRRKTAANAIAAGLKTSKALVVSAMENLGLDPGLRAERLRLCDYAALSALL
ncbi:MAG: 16S rRNA (adenine(1518)-N(6)/adenine(1519)-N(6))-dimethyltransferase RsmA [Oscillospiraceae bacterium]|nr:16S rRNA (adenine(1518)-N(6)/adenine(1519)-N(6))-dimethyltransferase RsmA [Oscillospiraceae bacterium]